MAYTTTPSKIVGEHSSSTSKKDEETFCDVVSQLAGHADDDPHVSGAVGILAP
jgi:hypothetical protein